MFRLVSVLVAVLAAVAAQAHITTSHVRVYITGARCGELHNVFLVIDDHDNSEQWIQLKDEGNCHWATDLGEHGSISTKLSHFSLRVDFGRTDCHQAAANEKEVVAEIEVACCNDTPRRDVHVTVVPQMPVSYLRTVTKASEKRTFPIDCTEGGTFGKGTGIIKHTQFSDEKVYLQLGMSEPKKRMLGLPINDIVVDGGTVVLTRDGVVYRLVVQRAKGKAGSAPTFSSSAISLDIKQLTELKLESAEFEVIK